MDDTQDADSMTNADERLVHGLLAHVYDAQAEQHREQRVQRAMQAIRAPSATSGSAQRRLPPAHPWWRRLGLASIAASILAVIGLLFITSSPSPAMVTLTGILQALGLPGDRVYHIQMIDQPAPAAHRPVEENWPQGMPRPGLDGGELHLRDARAYLLVRHDPLGGLTYDGYDGRQSWRVKGGVLAETHDGLGAGGIPMPPIMAEVAFTDLRGTLERVLEDYNIEEYDQASRLDAGGPLHYVKVRRNSSQVKGPETVELWADPEGGIPRRIVFDGAKLQGNPHPCRITFDLFSEQPLSKDWFTPHPHLLTGK